MLKIKQVIMSVIAVLLLSAPIALAQVISKLNPPGLSAETAKLVDSLVDTSLFRKET